MSNLKWPLIWKNIKLDIINKQLILLELVYRFGLKHIILKKAQMRMITLLSFRLWATKIVCRQLDCGTFVMAKSVSIKEKIKNKTASEPEKINIDRYFFKKLINNNNVAPDLFDELYNNIPVFKLEVPVFDVKLLIEESNKIIP